MEDKNNEVQFVNEYVQSASDSRIKKEREWKYCKLFVEGYQSIRYRSDLGTLWNPPTARNKKTIIYNKLKPKVWDFASLLNSTPTRFETVPNSNDDNALINAEYVNRLIPYAERTIRNEELNINLDGDVATYGVAYKLATWNELIGTFKKGKYSGEVYGEVLTPFEVLKQNGVKKLRDSKRVVILKLRSKEWLSEKFPDADMSLIMNESKGGVTDTHRSLEMMDKIEESAQNIVDDKNLQSGKLLVKAMLELPSEKYPKGRMILVVGDTLLSSEDLPYDFMRKDGTFNLFEYRYNPLDNSPYPKGMVIDLIDAQVNRNDMIGFGYENTKLTSKSKITLPDTSGVKDTDITAGNDIIRYTPTSMGHTPKFISANAMSNDYINQVQFASDSIDEISNIGKALSGDSIKNVRSASHFAMFQEVDMRKLSLYAIHKEKTEAEFIQCVIKLMKQYYTKDRLIEITGDDSELEISQFKAGDINFKNIYAVRGSSIPISKAAQNEFLSTLAQTGMIPPDMLLQNIGFGDYKRTIDYKAVDMENATKECMLIKEGYPADFKDFDNHAIHFNEHEYVIKTESFKKIANLPMQVDVKIVMPAQQEGGEPTEEILKVGEITREQYMRYHMERHFAPLRAMMKQQQEAMQQNGENKK